MDDRIHILTDNGSRRPDSWVRLVGYARALSDRVGREVHPVSMMHADEIAEPPTGVPPPAVMRGFLAAQLAAGRSHFRVLPLFLGPSGAVTRALPRVVEELRPAHPELDVEVAPFLHATGDDAELLAILEDHVEAVRRDRGLARPPVVLCDHGSPNPDVTAVRDQLAARLADRLGDRVAGVLPASMERRPGDEYAFNDPLLAARLAAPELADRDVVLAMLFLSPGRHAGAGGDIDEIVAAAPPGGPRVHRTPLLGEHPALIDLLARRLAGT